MADFGRFGGLQVQADYGQIWQISADYKYKQTLWSDLADFDRFGGLQVQQQTLWFAAVDLVDYRLDVTICVELVALMERADSPAAAIHE